MRTSFRFDRRKTLHCPNLHLSNGSTDQLASNKLGCHFTGPGAKEPARVAPCALGRHRPRSVVVIIVRQGALVRPHVAADDGGPVSCVRSATAAVAARILCDKSQLLRRTPSVRRRIESRCFLACLLR